MPDDEIPENFIDALRFKAAMGWADEHRALLLEIDDLTDMLSRCCTFIDKVLLDIRGYKMPSDIEEWWIKYQAKNKDKKC